MSLIEGIGDEVLHFFIIVFLLMVAALAWWSTRISERPLIRTVLILERQQPRQVSGQTVPTPSAPPPDEADKPEEAENPETAAEVIATQRQLDAPESSSSVDSNVRPEQVSTLRNRRLAFFEDAVESSASSSVPAHNANLKDLLSEGSQPESSGSGSGVEPSSGEDDDTSVTGNTDGIPTEDVAAPPVAAARTENNVQIENQASAPISTPDEPPTIRIRLKYLNDDLKLVEGNLEEQLGDFKKRHFSLELSGRKLVRLIFNGQVLGQDTWTLGHYGLFDNCVVHCLVHQPRTPPPSPNLNSRTGSTHGQPMNPWVLSNVLLASLSLLLALAWYGRYQYAQLYTATTTVALVGLTGIFTISLIGIYMPDPAHS